MNVGILKISQKQTSRKIKWNTDTFTNKHTALVRMLKLQQLLLSLLGPSIIMCWPTSAGLNCCWCFFFLQVAPFSLCRAGLSPLKQFRSTTPVIRCFKSSNLSASTSSVNSSLSCPSIWHVSDISQTKQSLSCQHWLLCSLFLFLCLPVLSAGCRNTLVLCSVYSWTCLDIDWRRKKARDSLSSISSHLIINVLICDKSADEPLQNNLLVWVLWEKPWLQSASWHSIFINV